MLQMPKTFVEFIKEKHNILNTKDLKATEHSYTITLKETIQNLENSPLTHSQSLLSPLPEYSH